MLVTCPRNFKTNILHLITFALLPYFPIYWLALKKFLKRKEKKRKERKGKKRLEIVSEKEEVSENPLHLPRLGRSVEPMEGHFQLCTMRAGPDCHA